MNFHDDSHILSKLGILASRDECPHKIRSSSSSKVKASSEKDRFVDVSIDGLTELKSDSDEEEPIFDINSLLSPSKSVKIYRKEPETYTCMYLILLLTYFGVGVWCPLSSLVVSSSNKVFFSSLFGNSAGLLLGSIAGKFFCKRISITLLLLFCTAAVCVCSWIISDFSGMVDLRITDFLLGFFTGSILYGGLATWFIFWRGYNRKVLFFYVLLAIGSSLVLFFHDPAFHEVVLHKREAFGSIADSGNMVELESVNDSTTTMKFRKPQVVQGITRMESKSEQNQQMRKALGFNAMRSSNVSSFEMTSAYPTILPTEVFQNSSGGNSIFPFSDITTAERSAHATAMTVERSSSSLSRTDIPPMNVSPKGDRTGNRVAIVVTTIMFAIYLVSFACCCLPFAIKSDMKFLKLFDSSVAGLTKSCRLRLATVQTIASFLESLVGFVAILLSSQRDTYYMNILHHVVVVITRSFVIICGQCAYSIFGCCLALICSSLGSLLLLFSSADPFTSFVLLSMSTGVFGLLVFLHVEVRVHPRSGTQLDYYIFPSLVGRFLSVVLFTFLQPDSVSQIMNAVLVSSALLIMVSIFLARSVGKAARLKEIMEYSSSPVLDACGEYVSLMEDDVGLESSQDDKDEVVS